MTDQPGMTDSDPRTGSTAADTPGSDSSPGRHGIGPTGSTYTPADNTAIDESYVYGGGLAVGGALAVPGVAPVLSELQAAEIPSRLVAKDTALWGEEAKTEASIRLGWLDLPQTSRDLLDRLAALRAELMDEGLTRVVLAGMGGSSLAPEVICRTLDLPLTVLDTTDPHQIRSALREDLHKTIVVVSSKSGGTVETDSHRRAYWQAFIDAGLSEEEIGRRFVIVTDPGSPLASVAQNMPARAIFLADPNVGGRYSALSAFGLVPSALAGANIAELLDQGTAFAATLPEGGPALALGAALGVLAAAGRDKLILADDGSGIVGLGDWIEQLIAESTGKHGTGILPVVVESPERATSGPGRIVASVGGAIDLRERPADGGHSTDLAVNGPLGAQFLAWEYATAIAGHLLEINPFDQPNVAESKENTSRILSEGLPVQAPAFVDGAVEVYGDAKLLAGAENLASALQSTVNAVTDNGYLALMAYLDRWDDAHVAQAREALASATEHPVTFGWGPRFLHSTGQYHKGGPQNGVFIQITGAVREDAPVPGQPYTFGELQAAQAAGDLTALQSRGRPVLRLHFTDRARGTRQLLEAVSDR